jgi:hypothetical protein
MTKEESMSKINQEKDGNPTVINHPIQQPTEVPAFRDIFKKKVPPLTKAAIDAMGVHEDDLPIALKGILVGE